MATSIRHFESGSHRVGASTSSALVPARKNTLDLFMPRLIDDFFFQAHLQAGIPEGVRLAEPLVVVHDGLLLGRERLLQHFSRLVSMGYRATPSSARLPG
jgi:hypothetical protein